MRVRVCERCGQPDYEVGLGFLLCRGCFHLENLERSLHWAPIPDPKEEQ